MSSSIPATYPFLNGPLINTITGCIVQIQERKILTRKRLHSLIHYSSITTGFFVLLYFLIHIQILFFWFLKLIFRIIFKIVSTIFWLPLRTARFFTPKTIDYDILFPLFWLCSISSFYLSKFFHENICQFYDQHLVRRYKIFNYNQAKRDDIKRYLFILTFILLLILQSVFILIPIAASIRRHNENTKTPAVDRQTMTITSATVKSAATEAVETMNENLYNRFIDAFKDETESHKNKKRQPLIEHTGKKIQKSFKNQINNLKPTNKQNKTNQDNKSSRFQRWIIHYLKAPFQKWESKKHEDINTKIEKKNFEDENEEENIELSSSSSIISDTDENNDEDDETDDQEEHSTITKQIQQRIDTIKHFGHKLKENVKSKISSKEEEEDDDDDDDDDEDEDDSLSSEERLTKAIETAKNIGAKIIKTKFSSSTVDDDEESGYESDDEEEKQSSKLPEKVKKALAASIITVKNVAANIKNKIVSSTDEEDEQSTPITEQIKEHIGKPIEDKLSSLTKHDESENDLKSFIEHKKESIEKEIKSINDTISASVDHLKQTIANRVDSAEDFFSNTFEKSSKFLKESIKQIPKSNEVLSKIKEQIVEPIESKISHAKEVINTKHQHLKETTDDEIKSLKKKKKEIILTEKEKDKLKSLNKIAHEKISRHEKKKQTIPSFNKKKFKLKIKRKLNGYFDDAWNIWHLAKRKLAHIFTSSTKHARHLPRYNTTSLYTAYTDLKCYDYIKQLNRYRLLKRKHLHFLDTYRHHSPFPVYLSILKSNGPRCYRHYPNSSCALVLKSSNRNFKTQLYRFARFWAIIGILVIILAAIYAALTDRKQTYFSLFHHQEDSNRSSKNKQRTTMSNKNDLSKSTTAIEQKTSSSSINQQTVSSNTKTYPLNQQIEKHLRLWLQNEKNDGFRNLSEACRIAINNTFLKKHEQLSVETLQFANAKIRDVSQTNNNNNSETPAEKIVINAVLDIDHLIINIINTFREQHFSVETPKLSGQLYILLVINPNQYSIEANLQQLHLNPVNIIDPNNTLLTSEKQSIIRLLDETINRTTVRCSFRLSDHQDDTNYNTLYNSAVGSYPDSNKIYSSNNQPSSLSIQSVGSRSRESNYTRYQLSEPPPTLLINDTTPYLYTKESEIEKEPKRLLVRIVKAVKLHDVEQPYCILELNHPKQIKQTDTAKNGLNPFWDERFVFECNEQSNQIRLQIIDRKKSNTRTGNNYDLCNLSQNTFQLLSFDDDRKEQTTGLNNTTHVSLLPLGPRKALISQTSNEASLTQMQSTGFTIETPTHPANCSVSLLETKIKSTVNKRHELYQSFYTQRSLVENSSSYNNNNDNNNNNNNKDSLPSTELHYQPCRLKDQINKIEQDYQERYQQSSANDYLSSSYDAGTLPKHYGLPSSLYDDDNGFVSTLPRSADIHSNTSPFLQSLPLTPRDGDLVYGKAHKSKSFMSSLKHLTLPRRKHHNKDKHDNKYFLETVSDPKPIRRSRSISKSFKNLFRSNSKKKANAAKADALGEYENGTHKFIAANPNFLSTSTPTTKKLSFLHRHKSKQKTKEQTNYSANSLASYDCSSSSS
ncbi:unnamed protein product [Rotaria sp. Silwood2]|nr:unnamed protein product [Rotaria sp. Silwood2]